ncbi:helix-turn-helix transcriptional regulator [Aureibacter tunicatorum]|uniref:AraC-like DNA-binding protein n=1 Tax=Aureibacter tunicatorum TaxID=866807 RepID=A0AAE3XRU4_9BACT|nr:AraC family transcriptional regulator [Aureibacter tunicatorum]MDR6241982.1 AraC-like DNA-binding protein [Aureibacter tunicatorum]BDD07285.1 AraC family transcriptional regulator [Aureibacter tunicatorum]
MSKEIIEIKTTDYDNIGFFKKFSQERNGNWDGEMLNFTDHNGTYQVVTYNYPNMINVGVTDIYLNQPFMAVNESTDQEKYFSLRIGFHGNISNIPNSTMNSEGIFMYDATQPFKITYPAKQRTRWMSIRVPYSFFKDWNYLLTDSFSRLLTENPKWYFYFRLPSHIESLVRDCFMIVNDKKIRKSIFYSRAYEIIARISILVEDQGQFIVKKNIHADDLSLMLQLKEYLLQDFSQPPSIEKLSKKYHMSISKIQRSFQSVYGISILKFFNQHRLEEAQRQIKYTDKTLLTISEELGFNSLPHFSSAFKKQFNENPSDLRK